MKFQKVNSEIKITWGANRFSRDSFDFRFFYPLITLTRKITPYQKNCFQTLHNNGGKMECWPGLTNTFKLLEKKGIPLKFTRLPADVPFTDDRTLVELIYPNF